MAKEPIAINGEVQIGRGNFQKKQLMAEAAILCFLSQTKKAGSQAGG